MVRCGGVSRERWRLDDAHDAGLVVSPERYGGLMMPKLSWSACSLYLYTVNQFAFIREQGVLQP